MGILNQRVKERDPWAYVKLKISIAIGNRLEI